MQLVMQELPLMLQQQQERPCLSRTQALGGVHVAGHRRNPQGSAGDAHHVVTQCPGPEAELRVLLPGQGHVVHLAQGRAAGGQAWVQQGSRFQGLMLDHGSTVRA